MHKNILVQHMLLAVYLLFSFVFLYFSQKISSMDFMLKHSPARFLVPIYCACDKLSWLHDELNILKITRPTLTAVNHISDNWPENCTYRIVHNIGDWRGCKVIALYLFHILQGNIMWTSTARTTRDHDHALLCCSAYCCDQVCSWVRYIATPICHYGNTFYWRRQTSFDLKITKSLIDPKIQKDSGLKKKFKIAYHLYWKAWKHG